MQYRQVLILLPRSADIDVSVRTEASQSGIFHDLSIHLNVVYHVTQRYELIEQARLIYTQRTQRTWSVLPSR